MFKQKQRRRRLFQRHERQLQGSLHYRLLPLDRNDKRELPLPQLHLKHRQNRHRGGPL